MNVIGMHGEAPPPHTRETVKMTTFAFSSLNAYSLNELNCHTIIFSFPSYSPSKVMEEYHHNIGFYPVIFCFIKEIKSLETIYPQPQTTFVDPLHGYSPLVEYK